MSLSYKHSPFGLQEFPMFLVSVFLHLAVFCYFISRVPPRFLFYRNECRTTLVFPSCQIKKLLSEYIERKDTVSNVLYLMLFAVCGIHSLVKYLSCRLEQGLFLLSPYTLCKPLEVLCRLRITENGSLRFQACPIQLLSFGFNSPQLLLLVVVAPDLFGVRLSPVARKLNQSLSVLAVILRVVLRDVATFTLSFSVLSDSVGVRPSPFPVPPHHLVTVQGVVSACSLTIVLSEFLVSVLLLSSHCIP